MHACMYICTRVYADLFIYINKRIKMHESCTLVPMRSPSLQSLWEAHTCELRVPHTQQLCTKVLQHTYVCIQTFRTTDTCTYRKERIEGKVLTALRIFFDVLHLQGVCQSLLHTCIQLMQASFPAHIYSHLTSHFHESSLATQQNIQKETKMGVYTRMNKFILASLRHVTLVQGGKG